MNIFITGGAGFIGSNTAAHFLEKGDQVTIYDNLSRPGVSHNLNWLQETFSKQKLRFIKGDVSDNKLLENSIVGSDIVFHFAGQTAVTTSIENPRADFMANALGTFNILEAVRQHASDAVVLYSSTNKVYGAMSRINTSRRGKRYYGLESASADESESLDFYSPYGCSKGTGDQYMQDYHRIYGLKTIVFRQSCIYGAHQFGVEDQGWVAHFVAQAIKGNTLKIFGDGRQVRDLLYITDLVDAFDRATGNPKVTAGQIYNIGGGISNSLSLLELIDLLQPLISKKIKTSTFEERQGDQKVYISNIDKAYRDLDWTPQVNVKQGITLLHGWLQEFIANQK